GTGKRLTRSVVVVEHTVGDVPVSIGHETSSHQNQSATLVAIERERVVAGECGIGEGRIDDDGERGGSHERRRRGILRVDRERGSAGRSWRPGDHAAARIESQPWGQATAGDGPRVRWHSARSQQRKAVRKVL